MNDWVTYAIPLIALVIWILSNLAKGNEQQKKGPAGGDQRQPPPQQAQAAAPAQAGRKEKIDQFLQEINERRKQREGQGRVEPPPRPAPPPQPPVVVRPKPTPPPVRAERPTQPQRVLEALPAEPILEALPSSALEAPLGMALTAQEARLLGSTPSVRQTVPTHLRALRSLLESGRGLRTAFMLQEVLGPPRCKKPLRRQI
jgi:hypothetical protein